MTERETEPADTEVPVEDALEQRADVTEAGSDDVAPDDAADEADPADRAEQRRTVDPGDDEYR